VPELPHGTVTFAFTDIEGSTALLKQLGDGFGDVLTSHRRLVRDTFADHRGVEIDTQGDAFFYVFERARDAVAAAAQVQRAHADHDWPPGVQVRVRIGLHTGEPTVGDEGYLGIDVVRAARLCGVCRGGQVLLSETTRALVGSALPEGVSVFPLGERHLKDIDEPERIFELEIDGLERVPDLASSVQEVASEPSEHERERQWEADFERRVADFTERVTRTALDRRLGRRGRRRRGRPQTWSLDDIGSYADELARRITSEVEKSLLDTEYDHGNDE
jgi:class 3 adenylate cyclase